VAKNLGWEYLNADFSLAPSIGRSAVEIIRSQGVERFHECLSDILFHQISKNNIVVTTDDSIILSDKSRQLLEKEFTVYLKVSTSVQLERISPNRPLLSVIDYKTFLHNLHPERDALYQQVASLTFNSDDNALEEHVAGIIKALKK
jgi:shikimate kinase